MSFLTFFSKIWVYLGFFYLSLIFFLLLAFITKRKKQFLYLLIVINLFFSFKTYFTTIPEPNKESKRFFLSYEEKMNLASSNQYKFLQKIKNFLPDGKKICYPEPYDVAGRFAQNFLYPKKVIIYEKNLNYCDFLVLDYSLSKKDYPLAWQLQTEDNKIFLCQLGEVYKINQK